ncbi:hypothetical protein CC117_29070 [Parafrankia colletiae]|uniref:Uncharacterized protein n=1 Tax=Parafrankia colletiae TaxID=573497 RepID=A0A1S1Q681_9ACTN|nr:hypothetical protein CC117_29070 [Parafrankia colletiae]
MWLGVDRFTLPVFRPEEQAEAPFPEGIPEMHRRSKDQRRRIDVKADLLAGLTTHGGGDVLSFLQLARRNIPPVIRETGTSPQSKQNCVISDEQEHDVDDAAVRHGGSALPRVR